MKNVLKLGVAAMAVAALAACGGGGSSDVADTYVGSWKSNCTSYTGNDGNTYYSTWILNLAKVSAAELAATTSNRTAHSDAGCKNPLGAITNYDAAKINIGAKTTFLGAAVDSMVYTVVTSGEARQGFINADSTNLYLVVANNDGSPPRSWSFSSPFTKQ
jgi:hypothetical protein